MKGGRCECECGCGRDCGVGPAESRKVGECAEPGPPHGILLGALCCSKRCVPILDTVSPFWTLDTAASRSRGTSSLALMDACECVVFGVFGA